MGDEMGQYSGSGASGRMPKAWRAPRAWRRVAAAGAAGTLAAAAMLAGAAPAAARPAPAALAFSPSPYHYGQVAAGQAASRAFTLANTGGRATGKLTVALAGPAAFTITANTCKHSLAPRKSCTVTVRFAPLGPAPSPPP